MPLEISRKSTESLYSNSLDISFPRATRESRSRLHISQEHDATVPNVITPGPIYDIPTTLGQSHACKFGSGLRPTPACSDDTFQSSTDALGIIPDVQLVRFPSTVSVKIGTESRDEIRNAAVMKYNPEIFYGTESPGPATYSISGENPGPRFSLGSRTEVLGSKPQTSVSVGPGSYPHPTYCGKAQFQSHVENQPVYSFSKSPSLSAAQTCSEKVFRKVGVIVDAIGPQVSSTKRTGPRPVMGTQTREQWSKSSPMIYRKNPTTKSFPIPKMLPRGEIIRWSS